MSTYLQIDTASPDYTQSRNAFFIAMNNARRMGFAPPTELVLAEHLMRGEVKILYYRSSSSDVFSIVQNEGVDFWDEDSDDILALISQAAKRRREKRLRPSKREMLAEDIGILSTPTGDEE